MKLKSVPTGMPVRWRSAVSGQNALAVRMINTDLAKVGKIRLSAIGSSHALNISVETYKCLSPPVQAKRQQGVLRPPARRFLGLRTCFAGTGPLDLP